MKDSVSTLEGQLNPSPWQVRIDHWCRTHLSQHVYFMLVAVIIGALTGFGAFLLKWSIAHITDIFSIHFSEKGPNYVFLVLPLAGFILVRVFMRYVLHYDMSHGIDKVQELMRQGVSSLRPSLGITPIIASSFTLGFGGSAGAEGPIATVGASIGSSMGRIMGISKQHLMIMIGCGAGAGIAAIFKAPVGGMLFTLEVMGLPMTTLSVLALLVASIVASLTCYSLTGFTFDVDFMQAVEVVPDTFGYVALLGIFCGLYALYYSKVMQAMGRVYSSIKSPWIMSVAAAILLGLLLFLFPALYGEGYGVTTGMVNGDFAGLIKNGLWFSEHPSAMLLLLVTAGIMIVKPFATASTTWGGVAGDFAPLFFAGCMAGYVFTAGVNLLFGLDLPVADFSLIAMAAVMGTAVNAPLMAIFLTVEMTGNFHLFMPIVIATAVAYGVRAIQSKLRNIAV